MKTPAVFALAWGVLSAGVMAVAAAILSDCPNLLSPESWHIYFTAFATAAGGKYMHSGRSKV